MINLVLAMLNFLCVGFWIYLYYQERQENEYYPPFLVFFGILGLCVGCICLILGITKIIGE